MNRALITCGTITSSLTYMKLNSQKERKERLEQKIFKIYKIFHAWSRSCTKSHLPPPLLFCPFFLDYYHPFLLIESFPLVVVGEELPDNVLAFFPSLPFSFVPYHVGPPLWLT